LEKYRVFEKGKVGTIARDPRVIR